MKKVIWVTHLVFFGFYVSAQPTIEWQKCLGGTEAEVAYSVQQTSDGGYIAAGNTSSNDGDILGYHGFNDFWVVKLTSSSEIEWQRCLGGSSLDFADAVQQTLDGGFIVAGFTESNDGDVTGNHGDKDMWLVKLSAIGNLEWQKCFGGSGEEDAWSVCHTNDGGYILAGQTTSNNGDVTGYHGGIDFWVVKLDSLGTIEWQRALGGSKPDIAHVVKQTQDGGYIVAGDSESINGDVSGGHGSADCWVVKLSATGMIEWQKMLGGSNFETANDIVQSSDGGYAIIGLLSSNDGDAQIQYGGIDYWVVKLSSDGEIQWQKTLGGTQLDYGEAIHATKDGGFVLAGSSSSTDVDVVGNDGGLDIWVVKIDSTGNLQWQKTYGGAQAERAYSIRQTSDNGFVVAGHTKSNNNGDVSGFHGVQDVWIVKLSPETSGASEQNNLALSIYPNPTSQSVTIQVPSEESELKVWVYDLFGRVLFSKEVTNGGNLDLEPLTTGTFLLKANTEDGLIYWGKLNKI